MRESLLGTDSTGDSLVINVGAARQTTTTHNLYKVEKGSIKVSVRSRDTIRIDINAFIENLLVVTIVASHEISIILSLPWLWASVFARHSYLGWSRNVTDSAWDIVILRGTTEDPVCCFIFSSIKIRRPCDTCPTKVLCISWHAKVIGTITLLTISTSSCISLIYTCGSWWARSLSPSCVCNTTSIATTSFGASKPDDDVFARSQTNADSFFCDGVSGAHIYR